MTSNISFVKRHWKPPFGAMKLILIALIILANIGIALMQQTSDSKEDQDDIEIVVNTTAYNIKFSLADTENYELYNVTCKGIKNVEQPGNSEHICENLDPCSSYLATLVIKVIAQDQVIEKTIDANTDFIEPTVTINEINAESENITLTWNATDKTCISNFQIELKSVDKEIKTTIANDKNELLVDGLNPCQAYDIQLKTYDINDKLVSNLTETDTTLYKEPGSVSITIVEYDNAQVKVSWDQPQYKTCINYYYLKWFVKGCLKVDNLQPNGLIVDDSALGENETSQTPMAPDNPDTDIDDCQWSANLADPNAKEYVIGSLQGCEVYVFEIYINDNETLKCEQQEFTAPEQVPGTVVPKSPQIDSTNITLLWSPPLANSKCVDFYEIHITGPLQKPDELETKSDSTHNTEIFFNELSPCGEYNVSVIAVSHNGSQGIAFNTTYGTIEAKPTPVRNYKISAQPSSLEISWDPPAFADLCLNGYRISGWGNDNVNVVNFDRLTNDTLITITELNSCQSYTVQIIPTTKTMDGGVVQIDTETTARITEAASNFEATGHYPDGFELKAKDLDANNTCETIFARFVCSTEADVPHKTAEQYVEEGKVGGISFTALLTPLSPYTSYRCVVALYNIAGWSPTKSILVQTEPYFPDSPELVSLKSRSNSSINFSWKQPNYTNGNIKLYIYHFQHVEAAYYIPPKCSITSTEPIARETSSLEQSFSNLLPYSSYSIQVAAQNEYGIGEFTRPYSALTLPWISEPVNNLKVISEGPFESETEYKANVLVSWLAPCKSNGEIEFFILEFIGERMHHEREYFEKKVLPEFNEEGGIVYNETRLKPEYNYTVTVVVQTKNVEFTSSEIRGEFDAPAGIPKKLNDTVLDKARVDAFEANNPTISAVVRFPADVLESESGSIVYIALLISERGCNPEPDLKFGALNTNIEWPDIHSWNEIYENGNPDCIYQYQTTPLRWKPIVTRSNDLKTSGVSHRHKRSTDEIEYIIGTEKCVDTSKRYCNGPLKADTEYDLIIRLFTKSGYNDAAVLQFRTDSLIQLTIILVSVCSCLLLAFIAGFIYLWITKRIIWHRESSQGIEDSFGDVIAKNFAIFYREISKPEKISREFKELTVVAMDLSYSASELGCHKNRYADIYPYDKNRVILDIDSDGSDYINASFIDGYRRKKEYIATQGPKPESTMDFWRMVLQHNVRVIVMVTQFREGDVVKCHEYYPYKSKGINVSIKKKESFELYDRTEMSVTHDSYGLKQKVVHFYFKKWPDHGCPTDPMSLISLVRKVKSEKVPSFSPIVVHCSAGVGRTGTFIGLDIIMQRLKNESKFNIYETVKKLRFQRMKMVQTPAQYTFLYTCAYELVKHKNARATMKYKNKSSKKVSFQDDAEINIGTVPPLPPARLYGRRTASDLSSVYEHETEDIGSKNIKVKPTDSVSASIPIRFSRAYNGTDFDDEHTGIENSTESAM